MLPFSDILDQNRKDVEIFLLVPWRLFYCLIFWFFFMEGANKLKIDMEMM
jgi:hypothetical protein